MRSTTSGIRSTLGVALICMIAGCAGDDATGPAEPSVADLAGLWMGMSFSITSTADPALKMDLMGMGGTLSWAIQASGSFSGTAVVPGALLGQEGAITIPVSGVMRVVESTTLRVDFVPEIPPFFTAFTSQYSVVGDVLTLHDDGAKYDFDGDGVNDPAVLHGTFSRN